MAEKGKSHSTPNSQGSVVSNILNDLNEVKTILGDIKQNQSSSKGKNHSTIELNNGDDLMDLFDKYFDEQFRTGLKNDIKQTISESMNETNGNNNNNNNSLAHYQSKALVPE